MAANGRSRHELTLAVLEKKERLFGSGDRKYNPQRSAQSIIRNPKTNEPPSMAILKWAADAPDEELIQAVGSDDDYAFLYYK
jgi:hypothetical protein